MSRAVTRAQEPPPLVGGGRAMELGIFETLLDQRVAAPAPGFEGLSVERVYVGSHSDAVEAIEGGYAESPALIAVWDGYEAGLGCPMLCLDFWDSSDPTDPDAMSAEEGRRVCEFVKAHAEARTLVVSCECGISRSAGMASALCRLLGFDDGPLWRDWWKWPNRACLERVLRAGGVALTDEEAMALYEGSMRYFAAELNVNRESLQSQYFKVWLPWRERGLDEEELWELEERFDKVLDGIFKEKEGSDA
ncbi:hypothetical protein QJ043_07095 [Olsenella sp. YH-ols2217]|uniref:Tyrosine specific protein phosphatases domain-containing protein n=1 Tax=Kribbibacterium absianum TaxID=3044210 RepID=A0ABT6ZLC1_9ACTN|nr:MULTISPECIES: hypothetical protein [unclassified Olsenella]MDJ1121832.1 hypothetical protein [Olsenella sp. YH-ols2216]MDJ1129840.1 hypothetical protein [Olsenella sp. YH-ols2217]